MRITIHMPDALERELKNAAKHEKKSVSAMVAEAVQYYVHDKRRKKAGSRILALAGKARIAPDAILELDDGRDTGDRA